MAPTGVATANVRDALSEGARQLAPVSDEAHLEAEILLRHVLGLDRTQLYQRLNEPLARALNAEYETLLARRLAHEPTAYIIGHREFFGRDLEVSPAAIIPRPETETLVELAITFARDRTAGTPLSIADIGTGSGAIAVSLAHALPEAHIIATDISPDALALAQRNAERHGVLDRMSFLHGDLLEPLDGPADLIVANLPYVRTADWQRLPLEIRDHEPRLGLDGGPDGLRVIERLLRESRRYLKPRGVLLVEIGDDHSARASALARAVFSDASIEIGRDLAGRNRVLAVRPH